MTRIQKAFQNGKALIPYITCADPDLDTTLRVVHSAVQAGADLIELGIPFSDPTAEGPVNQRSSLRALQGKVTTDQIFDMVRTLRKDVDVPMVFLTYANVVFSYGTQRFIKTCREIGIDGLILADIPYEEKAEFSEICRENGLSFISLLAPASKDRTAKIASEAQGFLYAVSTPVSAGDPGDWQTDMSKTLKMARAHTAIPCAVELGSGTFEQAIQRASLSDGVIADTAIIKLLEQYGTDAEGPVAAYVKKMKEALGAL